MEDKAFRPNPHNAGFLLRKKIQSSFTKLASVAILTLYLVGPLKKRGRRSFEAEVFLYPKKASGMKVWTDDLTWRPKDKGKGFKMYRQLDPNSHRAPGQASFQQGPYPPTNPYM